MTGVSGMVALRSPLAVEVDQRAEIGSAQRVAVDGQKRLVESGRPERDRPARPER